MAISGTDWLEVPIPYIRPIFQAYFSGNIIYIMERHNPAMFQKKIYHVTIYSSTMDPMGYGKK